MSLSRRWRNGVMTVSFRQEREIFPAIGVSSDARWDWQTGMEEEGYPIRRRRIEFNIRLQPTAAAGCSAAAAEAAR